ncbi:MAG: hypothetical protein JXA42_10425, partial [Anaerolineales bacterium]|nr:hypothetical protein [Anaerolineales bacterium]
PARPAAEPARPVVVPRYAPHYSLPEKSAAKQPVPENEPVARNVRWLLIGCATSAALLLFCLVLVLVIRIIFSQLSF